MTGPRNDGGQEPRRLLLMRHGKSEWPAGVADRDRPVGDRGRRESALVGETAAARGLVPDYVVMSPAERTRQTWVCVRSGLRTDPVASTDARIYASGPDEVFRVIHETPDEYRVLLLIGHNPTTQAVVGELDIDGAGPYLARLGGGFPTATLAAFDVTGPWDSVAPGTARWHDLIIPRELR